MYDEDGDGVYNGSLEINPGTSFEYVVAVTGVADSWSGWGMQWGNGCNNVNGSVTVNNVGGTTYTSLTPGCADVLGCMDTNALNYTTDATVQDYDQYGNLQCFIHHDDIQSTDVFMNMVLALSLNSLMQQIVHLMVGLHVKKLLQIYMVVLMKMHLTLI